MIELAALSLIAIAALVLQDHRFSKERASYLRAIDLAIAEGTKERNAHREQVSELATRIQAPEAAPFIVHGNPGKQYVTEDDDEEGWKAMKEQFEAENGREK